MSQVFEQENSENGIQSSHSAAMMTFEQAKKVCEDQMVELHTKIQDLSEDQQREYVEQAEAQCNEFLSKFMDQTEQNNEDPDEEDSQD